MNQLDKIIEITKETLKKSISYRPISSLEDDFEKYQKRGVLDDFKHYCGHIGADWFSDQQRCVSQVG